MRPDLIEVVVSLAVVDAHVRSGAVRNPLTPGMLVVKVSGWAGHPQESREELIGVRCRCQTAVPVIPGRTRRNQLKMSRWNRSGRDGTASGSRAAGRP